ncbi:uncharacterized protein MONBRDRAFT_1359, partial [Monosiga brevicollis MX1]
QVPTHDREGTRHQYFADDSMGQNVQDLLQRERLGLDDDQDAAAMRTIGTHGRGLDSEDYTVDDAFVDQAAKGQSRERREQKDRQRAVRDYHRQQKTLESCHYCLDAPRFRKNLVAHMGTKMILMVPERGALVSTHCVLVPIRHVTGLTELEEDEREELRALQRRVVAMFAPEKKDVVFFECSMRLHKQRHTVLHCVPLSFDDATMAPMFFKKAILESDAQWSQNKKLVDVREGGIYRAVPKGFPYFYVAFSPDRGFAHVVEDEELFPEYFGAEIIGGMLDVAPRTWLKPHRE